MQIYTVYDSKAEAYHQPIFSHNKATAIRSFTQAANEKGAEFQIHAEDYTLFEIEHWDEQTGTITPHDAKISLGSANEYVKNEGQLREIRS